MTNEEIAKIFEEIADMLEVSGEDFFRVRAYRNAARTVRDCPKPMHDMSGEEIRQLPGIGEDLATKIETLLRKGDLPLHRELSRKIPRGLLELMQIPGLGPKRVRILHNALGIHDIQTLRKAIEEGAVAKVKGFGPKIQERLREHVASVEQQKPRRLRYIDAASIVTQLLAFLRAGNGVQTVEVAGSFRRKKETVGDLDVVAVARSNPKAICERLTSFPLVREILAKGDTKTTVNLENGFQVDLRVVPPQSYGAALLYFTGSKAHGIHLRRIAQRKGLLLNEYGLFRGDKMIAGASEHDIYKALGLSWIPPELREDRGEIERAEKGSLPSLVEVREIRGDLHTHTTWTDGRASLEEMASAASERGLEYIAITDHSRRLAMVHGLDPKRLREQWREIERVQAQFPRLKLLRGIEVDILEDGSLDLPDEVLAELDWVVASVHYKLNQTSSAITKRLIKAIRNPHVDVIGHPTGRLINQREASSVDLAEVLRACREEGCALEVNSQPDRLDLNDIACLSAKEMGVRLVISTDAHHPRDFACIEYGVNQARRGWIEASDVLNTRPFEEFTRLRR